MFVPPQHRIAWMRAAAQEAREKAELARKAKEAEIRRDTAEAEHFERLNREAKASLAE